MVNSYCYEMLHMRTYNEIVPVSRDEIKNCVYMRKTVPANRGPRHWTAGIPVCRDNFFSYKRKFIFNEIYALGEALGKPRASVNRAETGPVFLI